MAPLAVVISVLALAVSLYFGIRNTDLQARLTAVEEARRVDETRPSFTLDLSGVENIPVITLNGPEEVSALRVEVVNHELHPPYFRKVWIDGGAVARMRPGDTHALRTEVDESARGGVLKLRLSGATRAGRFKDVIVEAPFTNRDFVI
jgi:hypothetical protein